MPILGLLKNTDIMEVRIQPIHFDIAEHLTQHINKKIERLVRHNPAVTAADVTLTVIKPECAMNKEAVVKITVPQQDSFVATKVADTFEEAVDTALEAIEKQLEKVKKNK